MHRTLILQYTVKEKLNFYFLHRTHRLQNSQLILTAKKTSLFPPYAENADPILNCPTKPNFLPLYRTHSPQTIEF